MAEKYAINQTLISLVAVENKTNNPKSKVEGKKRSVGLYILKKLAISLTILISKILSGADNKDKKGIADAIEKASKKPLIIIKIIIKKTCRFLFKGKKLNILYNSNFKLVNIFFKYEKHPNK